MYINTSNTQQVYNLYHKQQAVSGDVAILKYERSQKKFSHLIPTLHLEERPIRTFSMQIYLLDAYIWHKQTQVVRLQYQGTRTLFIFFKS